MFRKSKLALAACATLFAAQPALAGEIDYTLATEAFEQGLSERVAKVGAIGTGQCYASYLVWTARLVKMPDRDAVPPDLRRFAQSQYFWRDVFMKDKDNAMLFASSLSDRFEWVDAALDGDAEATRKFFRSLGRCNVDIRR